MSENENLGQAAKRRFFERKQRDRYLADANPDYREHESLYMEFHRDGFLDGAEWLCKKVFNKPLNEVMKS